MRTSMKTTTCFRTASAVLLCLGSHSFGADGEKRPPEFEFDTWGSPPSSRVYALSGERTVQHILLTIEESALTAEEIAKRVDKPPEDVLKTLMELGEYALARRDGTKWLSGIPLYTEDEIRAGEELGKAYANKEFIVLRRELPKLKSLFGQTRLSKHFTWNEVSLILVGGLLMDLCVVDRIPFMPDHEIVGLQPPLVAGSGNRWGYEGFQKMTIRFPTRKWKFYHNLASKDSGGMARFGHYGEQRPSQPSRPEGWMRFEQGKILFALAEGPRSFAALKEQSRLRPEILTEGLKALQGAAPPAIVFQGEAYRSRIPVLCQADLELLLPTFDAVAIMILEEVTRPHWMERVALGKAAGSRWPLPDGLYVRDKALQMLIEEGEIGPDPTPPVQWNFGVWGWKGFLPMHDDITHNVKPDAFLLTPISEQESGELLRLNRLKVDILQGKSLTDISTPAGAYLTRISAFANSDLESLKRVDVRSDPVDMEYLQSLRKQGWLDYISKVDIRRVPPVPVNPKEGDVAPVFTVHERGFEEAYVFFYLNGGWRYLGNTPRDGLWHTWAKDAARAKTGLLKVR